MAGYSANDADFATYKMKAAETTLNQYCCAVLDTATEGQVTRAAGANAGQIAGVLRDATLAAGETGTFQVSGVAKVAISASVAIGDKLVIGNAAGQVAPKGTGAHTSGTGIVGQAVSAATTAGSVIEVLLELPCEFSS